MDHKKENDGSENEKWQKKVEVIAECEGLGGILQAISAILRAYLSNAFFHVK